MLIEYFTRMCYWAFECLPGASLFLIPYFVISLRQNLAFIYLLLDSLQKAVQALFLQSVHQFKFLVAVLLCFDTLPLETFLDAGREATCCLKLCLEDES